MNCFAKEFLEQLCALIISMYFWTKSPSCMWFRGSETNFNFPAVYKFHPMVYPKEWAKQHYLVQSSLKLKKKTKIVRNFLNLVNTHFPGDHKLHKTLNRNKVSYSCTNKVEAIISKHNTHIIRKSQPDACAITRIRQRTQTCAERHGARVLKLPQGKRASQYC